MAQESAGITEACAAFICALNEGRYYDAHEDLEHLWFPRRFEDHDEVRLWKGFINATVSFELIRRGRPQPSMRAWQTYLKYKPLLKKCETEHYEMYVKMVQTIEQERGNLCPSS